MSSLALVICKLRVKTVHTFWKRKFLGVRWMAKNGSGGKNIVVNLLLRRLWLKIVVRGYWWFNYVWSWVFVGGGKIKAGCGWSWVLGVKLWLVVGGDRELMPGRGWWRQNYGWSWVVVDGRSWSLMVAWFSNALYQYAKFRSAAYEKVPLDLL